LREIAAEFIASLPAVVDVGEGAKVAIAESDVEEYPGLWLRGTGGNGLSATFPPYPLKEKLEAIVISEWLRALTTLPRPSGSAHSPGECSASSKGMGIC